jgi:hypothetical protein
MSPCGDEEAHGVENFVKTRLDERVRVATVRVAFGRQRVQVARVRVGSTVMARCFWRCCGCCGQAVALRLLRASGGAAATVGSGARRSGTAWARARKAQARRGRRRHGHDEVRWLGDTVTLGNAASTGGGLRWKMKHEIQTYG